jgi:hypothetical protein
MATGILHLHSLLRYLVLILLIISIVKAISGLKSDGKVINNKIEFYTLIAFHIQVLTGLMLYFISPTVQAALIDFGQSMGIADLRFVILEHPLVMLIAAVFVTIGYSKSKGKPDVKGFSKTILIYYGIALLLVLSRIPMDSWPFISSN